MEKEIGLLLRTRLWNYFQVKIDCFIDHVKDFGCVDHNQLWKIYKELWISDHLTCLLRNLYAGQEATVRTRHGKMDWFKIGKGICLGYILLLFLFNLHAEYIMQNSGMDEAQAGIKTCWEKYQWLQICRWYHPYGRKLRGTKEPLDEGESGEWKKLT